MSDRRGVRAASPARNGDTYEEWLRCQEQLVKALKEQLGRARNPWR